VLKCQIAQAMLQEALLYIARMANLVEYWNSVRH